MNLTHGLMAAVMLARGPDFENAERRASYCAVFSTLFLAIALKSGFEAVEISGLAGPFGRWAAVGTVASLVGGLLLAAVRGRRAPFPWTELRLTVLDKTLLAGLFASYLALVTASLLASVATR